jgi:PPOX class probable FMN-dependent enzyme
MEASRTLRDEGELREAIGLPTDVVVSKITDHLTPLTRRFIEVSPFLCIATSSPDGRCDVSPRGDPAGFVRILDERTLLIPDRPGNRIADTLRNILANPHVGLVFLIPGIGDSFRVNGRAVVVDDPQLLAGSAVDNKVPRLGILVEIEEAYTQCSKALIRSDLWNPEHHIDRSALPSSGAILRSVRHDDFDAGRYDAERAKRYARGDGLY